MAPRIQRTGPRFDIFPKLAWLILVDAPHPGAEAPGHQVWGPPPMDSCHQWGLVAFRIWLVLVDHAAEASDGGCSDELLEILVAGGNVRTGGAGTEAPGQGGEALPSWADHGHVARALGKAPDIQVPGADQDPHGRLYESGYQLALLTFTRHGHDPDKEKITSSTAIVVTMQFGCGEETKWMENQEGIWNEEVIDS